VDRRHFQTVGHHIFIYRLKTLPARAWHDKLILGSVFEIENENSLTHFTLHCSAASAAGDPGTGMMSSDVVKSVRVLFVAWCTSLEKNSNFQTFNGNCCF
jgi:hypothetical protein